ncbi:MAG: protein kinase, partial [Candidatus Eisenbacteria bacterium]|nr:protein kinase [Candidatus Eisenbacteria bacterium]
MSTSETASPHDLRSQLEAATRGRFEIDRELGRGGMGAVFLARQLNLDRKVAIKVLFPHQASDPGLRERFLREARTQSRFDHPNIVPIFDVAEEGGLSYFVMAFVDGPTLRARLSETPRPEPFIVTRVLREVGEALAYAHRVGVIHRDVKPENILIDPASGRAVITDFGIARIGDASQVSLTATFTRIGSPRYMAPEQAEGVVDLDGRCDQYALALIGYEMLAGRPAFDATNPAELLYKHRYEEAVALDAVRPDLAPALVAAIRRGMRKAREERFTTLDAFVEALASPVPTTVPRAAQKADRAMRWLLLGSGAFLAVVVLAVILRPRTVPPKPKAPEAQVSVPVDSTSRSEPRASRGGRAPIARLGAPGSAKVGEPIAFDAGLSEDSEDGVYGLEVRWDFDGDGRFDTAWNGQKRADHSYSRPGTQNVT